MMSALCTLCEGKLSDVHWQQGQSWLSGENVEWEAIDGGMLKVMGVICRMLSTNHLVHIPNMKISSYQHCMYISAHPLSST